MMMYHNKHQVIQEQEMTASLRGREIPYVALIEKISFPILLPKSRERKFCEQSIEHLRKIYIRLEHNSGSIFWIKTKHDILYHLNTQQKCPLCLIIHEL